MNRISRTGYNAYDKLDKEYYVLLSGRDKAPTSFFDRNKVIKEIDPDNFDVSEMNMDDTIEKIQQFLREPQ